ncbi:hypothetical protein bAD24_p01485 (plasmid) [Burkholderia sp. AD24]|nr:hypothetical protein bAD24_p01485 [Burkholderia sp. AD24]
MQWASPPLQSSLGRSSRRLARSADSRGGEVGSLVGGHFFGEGSDGQKWSMLGGGLLCGMAGAKGGAALEGRFFPEPAVVPSEIPESNPELAPRSGGNPALAGDPFSPDAVNARSAEFYKLYGDNPQRGTMSNVEARQWYLAEDAKIPDQLDPTASYESQAQQSFDLRNANRSGARELMSDRITADRLTREEPNRSWDDLVASKQAAGLSGDDVYKSIISSSQKTRVSVNKQLGLD